MKLRIVFLLLVVASGHSMAADSKPWTIYRNGATKAQSSEKVVEAPVVEPLEGDDSPLTSKLDLPVSSGPWQIVRPGQKEAEAKWKAEQVAHFDDMHPNSQLKQICQAEPGIYDCAKMAELLWCARSRRWSLKSFRVCGLRRIGENGYLRETKHPYELSRAKGLTPQKSAKEIEMFVDIIKQLSKKG